VRERAYSSGRVSLLVNLYSNTLRECRALWMMTLRGSRAGNLFREGCVFQARERTSPEPPRGLLGARSRRRQHHYSSSSLPLSNSVDKRRIFVTKKGWLWNLGGDVRVGAMASVSLNCQVRSFCTVNNSSIPPHLDDSPFVSFCSTFSFNLFSPLTC
jgi:hypothetical protein